MFSATDSRPSSCLSLAQIRYFLEEVVGWWREVRQEVGKLQRVVFQGAKGPDRSLISNSGTDNIFIA